MAKQKTQPKPLEPATEPEVQTSTPPAPKPEARIRIWRVSLQGVRVRVEDIHGRVGYQDHLDVEAVDATEALERFAAHNGIPWAMDTLKGTRKLASAHEPSVQLLE